MQYDQLIHHTISRLRDGWTPEEICGRLPIDYPGDARMRACHETVYEWIYAKEQRHRQLAQYLSRGHKKRRRRVGRRVHSERIKWRTSIHDRPDTISEREEFGHWESDTVQGLRGSGNIHTTVERTSRFMIAVKLADGSATETVHAQMGIYRMLPPHAARSVTIDNGREFAKHYQVADTLAIPTYFADPHSAYQRGTNEHFNGRLRKYLPKGTSFADLTQAELDEIITEINNRPRKILGWSTPAEVFQELCSTQTPT